jgi:hypothetical protein
MANVLDDASDAGGDLFAHSVPRAPTRVESTTHADNQSGAKAITREAPTSGSTGWGKGPIRVDGRKYRYDVARGKSVAPLPFGASKADRMDASEAGNLLHDIHVMYGIDKVEEARLVAFDNALFFEHTINGASLLQPGRGQLTVAGMQFDIQPLKTKLGVEQRRFFRAYADDIAANNKFVLDSYDVYDPESVEKCGYLHQLAAVRGLQKYPHLVHDSSDAGSSLSYDERSAIANSKRVVLESTVNQADSWLAPRTIGARAGSDTSSRIGGS